MIRVQHSLEQGSPEWHEFRAEHGGASEVPALFKCNPWYPNSPVELYWNKSGQKPVVFNQAMQHGHDNEQPAREWACNQFGALFEPEVWSLPDLLIAASLDGIDGNQLAEIKAPVKGRESKAYKHVAETGKPEQNYLWQCQQQLLVSGGDVLHFVVYDKDDPISCDVLPDENAHEQIMQAWAEYWEAVKKGAFPDYECTDPALLTIAEQLAEAQAKADAAAAVANELKKQAKARLDDLQLKKASFGNFTAFMRAGTTLDKKAAQLAGIDLSQFEKASKPTWTIRKSA